MEHSSDTVYDGKLLHENSYPQRAEKYTEIELSATLDNGLVLTGKIDFYDAAGKQIHEIKRSSKAEEAHIWQVKFYILLLELNGVGGVTGILEYPTSRQTDMVQMEIADRSYLLQIIRDIQKLLLSEQCPPLLQKKICKSCSYFDFCYADELPESL
jgi:CRISPR-associated exonuclease Cas4